MFDILLNITCFDVISSVQLVLTVQDVYSSSPFSLLLRSEAKIEPTEPIIHGKYIQHIYNMLNLTYIHIYEFI